MRYQFLTGWLLLVSSQDVESGFGDTFPELQEDILLLQMDVKLSRGLTQTADATSVSEGFQAADSESPALLSESFKSEVEGGVMFGPKTSAALFLLSSCTFGLLCLCGAKPFITAPYSEVPEEEGESEEVKEQSLLVCYTVVFMDAFGFGVYALFIPILCQTFSLQAHDMGTALAAFSLAQALATPFLGYLSDRFGRRPVLLAALAAESLAYLILSIAESFSCLLVGYTLAGASCGTIGVCNAYIAQNSSEEDRPVRLAYSSGSIALGLMLGPVVGAGLSHEGFSAAVRVCAVLSLVNWLFVFSSLAESENVLLRRQPKEESRSALESLPRLAWPLFFGAFLGNAGIAAAESCGALFVMDSYFRGSSSAAAESTQFFAYNMMISGVLVIMITNFVFPMLMHTLRQQKTMFLGVCLRIVGYAGLGLAPTKWCFLASQLAVVTGDSLAAPNLSALLTEVVGKSSYGIALGTLSTFQAAARVLDTLPFATMYEKVSHSAPFLTVAVLAVASGALWFVVYWQMQLQSFRTCALGHEMPAEIPTRSGYPVS
mmetsp:Transcript_20973/g.49124  ORF Transcript_20973/g.49124 Transcript_20973/m.49124 type:complete len:546 (+) Transcript_20973:76-1713(+)